MFGYQTRRGESAPNHKLDSQARAYIREQREKGATYAQIAAALGVCVNTVRKAEQGISYQGPESW